MGIYERIDTNGQLIGPVRKRREPVAKAELTERYPNSWWVDKAAYLNEQDWRAHGLIRVAESVAYSLPSKAEAVAHVEKQFVRLRRWLRGGPATTAWKAMNKVEAALQRRKPWITEVPTPPKRTLDEVLNSIVDIQHEIVAKAIAERPKPVIMKKIYRDDQGRIAHVLETEL